MNKKPNQIKEIKIPDCPNVLVATIAPEEFSEVIIFLPGGGVKIGKERFYEWQEKLAGIGVASMSLNFTGIGDTADKLQKSSLEKRIQEAVCAINWWNSLYGNTPKVLCGFSMGGYIALGLTKELPKEFYKLVLYASAAYAQNAHSLPFDNSFTEVIRKEYSWENSMSFSWLNEYIGEVLIVEAGDDKIVSKEITQRYKECDNKKGNTESVVVENMPHIIWGIDLEEKKYRDIVFDHINKFINN